ncbi:MAG: hypothetical protein K8I00_01660 [Candidatus Omnitrophica bacterium]|nr:hypothetical protein [Candidatus Omnitrophota bacterium]
MKTIKIILFGLVLAALSVLACHVLQLRSLNMPDAKWMWIQNVLHEQPSQQVDYVFIGSSRTWCAVRPQQLEAAWPGTKSWNFGRHWIGRDIDYLLLEQLLERHQVGHIFVEIIGQEKFFPHQYAKYIISPQQAWEEAGYHLSLLRWRDYGTYSDPLKERIKHICGYAAEMSVRLYRSGIDQVWQAISGHSRLDADIQRNELSGGFFVRDNLVGPKPEFIKRYGRFQPFFPVDKGPFIIPPNSYPDYYLRKMRALAARHHVEMSFVFISDFAAVLPHDQMFHYFHGMGEVYIPNLRRMYRSDNWKDKNHLYGQGSVALTGEIIRLLQEGAASSEEYGQYHGMSP